MPRPSKDSDDRSPRGAVAPATPRARGDWHRTLTGRTAIILVGVLLAGSVLMMAVAHRLHAGVLMDHFMQGVRAQVPSIGEEFEDRIEGKLADAAREEAVEVIESWGSSIIGVRVVHADGTVLASVVADGHSDVYASEAFLHDHDEAKAEARIRIVVLDDGVLAFVPVFGDGSPTMLGHVDVFYSLASTRAAIWDLNWKSWVILLAGIAAVSAVLVTIIRRTLSRPFGDVVAAIRAIADDRIEHAPPSSSIVEIERIEAAMVVLRERVTERLALAERNAEAEAKARRAEAERASAETAAREARAADEAQARAVAEAARAAELALIAEMRDVIAAAAAGDFGRRMDVDDRDGSGSDVPRLVNGLLDTIGAGLAETSDVFARLAGGELSARMVGRYEGALARLQADVNAAARQLDAAMAEVSERASDVMGDASDLSSAATDLSQRTEQTAHVVAETTRALDGMVASIGDTARLAAEARRSAVETERGARDSEAVVRDAIEGMEEIKALSGRIGKTLEIIDDIAFQTNLLALNAGVEAARAGPAGRGFAIVASEVRALARKVAEAAQQIGDLVRTSSERIEDGVGRVGRTGETLDALGRRIRSIGTQIEEIAEAAEAQAAGAAEMNGAMARIDDATQRNAAMFEETTAANMSLTEAATRMLDLVHGFRTTDGWSDAAQAGDAAGASPGGRAALASAPPAA